MSDIPPVKHNPGGRQFEIDTDVGKALLRYSRAGAEINLVHTEVPAAIEGQGYGSALVEAALAFAKSERIRVVPSCPFVAHYLTEHPEHASLVATNPPGAATNKSG